MVVRTRSALRDKTLAQNAENQAGPSKLDPKKRKTKPQVIPELDEVRDDNASFLAASNLEIPSQTLPILQSTPATGRRGRKKRHRRAPDPVKLSSSLPPSSPLITSPSNHAVPGQDDNPFGLFTIEMLKRRRVGMKTGESSRIERVYDDSGIEDLYATDEEVSVVPEAILPRTTIESQEMLDSPPHRLPRSPSKQNSKRKLGRSLVSTSGSTTPRLASSPSPVKPSVMDRPKPQSALKGKDVVRPKKKAKVNEMDASMMIEHLQDLLPKRPVRKTNRKDDIKTVEASTLERGEKKTGKKLLIRKKSRKKAEVSELNEEQEKARRERIEYFRGLDDYQLAKENVYVV